MEALVDQTMAWLAGTFLVILRVGAMMALLPAFGEQSVPQRIRLALTLAFTLIVAPSVLVNAPVVSIATILPEVVAGLILGIFLRLFIITLQVAGTIAAQSTSLSQLLGSAGMEPLPAIGHMLVIGGLALAALSGLHVRAAEYMIFSYEIFPMGQWPDAEILAEMGLGQIASAFKLGFTLAAPFVVASLIYNVTLGVINRAMPQLMVAFVGAPAITAGSIAILFLAMPIMLSVWIEAMNSFMASPGGR